MPLINARPNRVHVLRQIRGLKEPNRDTLLLYARFIGDTVDCVLNQLIETALGRDRDFLAWRAAHTAETPGGRVTVRMGPPVERAEGSAMRGRAIHAMTDARFVISLALAAIAGTAGLQAWPRPIDHPILGLIDERRPVLSTGLQYSYPTLWFTTPLIVFNVLSYAELPA